MSRVTEVKKDPATGGWWFDILDNKGCWRTAFDGSTKAEVEARRKEMIKHGDTSA